MFSQVINVLLRGLLEDRENLLNFYTIFTVRMQIFSIYLLNITNRRKKLSIKKLQIMRLVGYLLC